MMRHVSAYCVQSLPIAVGLLATTITAVHPFTQSGRAAVLVGNRPATEATLLGGANSAYHGRLVPEASLPPSSSTRERPTRTDRAALQGHAVAAAREARPVTRAAHRHGSEGAPDRGAPIALQLNRGLTATAAIGTSPPRPRAIGPYRTIGAQIVDTASRPVLITGLNWFGLETCTFAPHGLWARNWRDLLDQIVRLHYNTIRLPFSEQLLDPGSTPGGINYAINPDLRGLTGLQIMDRIIAGAGERGLRVILDQHRESCGDGTEAQLWYTPAYPQSRWLATWRALAQRYRNAPAVIGADLHNEPHGIATWGDGNRATDWRLAAEQAGDTILTIAPHWLIMVEGIEHLGSDWYWWGGNLSAAGRYPVRLIRPEQLVYEAHDYGPSVAPQGWFHDPTFPHNLPGVWQRHWAYLALTGTAPVFVGEFGGQSFGTDPEGLWQRTMVGYLRLHHIGYTYWALNPDSGDTGGLLQADWQGVDTTKQTLLATAQAPLLGAPVASVIDPAVGLIASNALDRRLPTTTGQAVPMVPAALPLSAPSPGVTIVTAYAHPVTLAPRGTSYVDLAIGAHAPLAGAIVDVEVDDAQRARVYQTWRSSVTIEPGTTRRLQMRWTIPPGYGGGTYTVKAGIFGAGWSRLLAWDDAVAALTVVAAPTRVQAGIIPYHSATDPAPVRWRQNIAPGAPTAARAPAARRPRSIKRSGVGRVWYANPSTIPPDPNGREQEAWSSGERTGAPRRIPAPRRMGAHGSGAAHAHPPYAPRATLPPSRAVPAATWLVASAKRLAGPHMVHRPHGRAGVGTPVRVARIPGMAIAPPVTATVRVAGLRLLTGPRLNAPVVAVMSLGMVLQGDRVTPHWMHVSVADSALSGWVWRASIGS